MILPIDLGANSYDIVLERGCLNRAGEYLNLRRGALIVTDSGLPAEYAKAVAAQCERPAIMTIPQGEDSKNFDAFRALLSRMLEAGFTRGDCVVAVGGGVVGDLAGFAAACYMRGVDFYNIPTTVLSQVDSSIGGKTAIDLNGVKNIVGAFYQPKRVLADIDALKTLPERQLSNGLSEAVKMALCFDETGFELFERESPADHLDEIIERALRIKKRVVEEDEKEAGLRRVLNFGHTLGHGIESLHDENGLYHGECVALGMLPMCSESVKARLLQVLEKLNLPTTCTADAARVMRAVSHDKKRAGDAVNAVLVNEVGTFEQRALTLDELRARYEACFGEGQA